MGGVILFMRDDGCSLKLKQKCIMSESHTCKTFFAKSKVPTFQIGLVYNHFRAKFSVDATSVCVCLFERSLHRQVMA